MLLSGRVKFKCDPWRTCQKHDNLPINAVGLSLLCGNNNHASPSGHTSGASCRHQCVRQCSRSVLIMVELVRTSCRHQRAFRPACCYRWQSSCVPAAGTSVLVSARRQCERPFSVLAISPSCTVPSTHRPPPGHKR